MTMINASVMGMGLHTKQGWPEWFSFVDPRLLETARECRDLCTKENVDISRLALSFALENDDIPLTLTSCASIALIV
eukprot:gene2234-13155_t